MTVLPAHPALLGLFPSALRDQHQPLRVTTQAKMVNLIAFALSHIRAHEAIPLVLHCLPPAPSPSSAAGPSTSTQPDSAAAAPAPTPTPKASSSSSASNKPTDALPKLVSVVEIIKREYASLLAASPDSTAALSSSADKGKGKEVSPDPAAPSPAPHGLHQYTLLTTLEVLGLAGPSLKKQEDEEVEQARQELIALQWLTGQAGKGKRPRRQHTPCMVVVLSLQPLDPLVQAKGFSYQAPLPPPKLKPSSTKHAREDAEACADDGAKKKHRRRKRTRGKKVAGEAGEDVDMSVELAAGVAAHGGGE
ncbi:hypothetical protein JCM1841_002106 [Sporobolomyces salmonicolor]